MLLNDKRELLKKEMKLLLTQDSNDDGDTLLHRSALTHYPNIYHG